VDHDEAPFSELAPKVRPKIVDGATANALPWTQAVNVHRGVGSAIPTRACVARHRQRCTHYARLGDPATAPRKPPQHLSARATGRARYLITILSHHEFLTETCQRAPIER
jgi:hypothetical protein